MNFAIIYMDYVKYGEIVMLKLVRSMFVGFLVLASQWAFALPPKGWIPYAPVSEVESANESQAGDAAIPN